MKELIKIDKLRVEFQSNKSNFIAIDDFSLVINEYEFVSIVGLSGCGKTTILNLLGGFLEPTGGVILFDGKKIQKPSDDRVMVFQEDAVFPWYSVKKNISYALDLRDMQEQMKNGITAKYMNAVGLTSFSDFFPKNLSGGMKKRVDLARAYAANPKVLLMDEPFGALDTYTRQQMQLQLLNLCESEKKTILFVTHDISEAIFLSDKIVLMKSNPGGVQSVFDVPFIRPRKIALKKSIEFIGLLSEIENLLHSQDKSDE